MRTYKSWIATASVCACIVAISAVSCFAYTAADVKRGEEMVAVKNYTGAVELLSGVTGDFDFCAASPVDAAKAAILLCDACEASAEKGSDKHKAAFETIKLSLAQVWADLKKDEPDFGARLEKIARVCEGHPQAFAEFLKPMLTRLVVTSPRTEICAQLDTALAVYRQASALVSSGNVTLDPLLLLQIGDHYAGFNEFKKAAAVSEDALVNIPTDKRELRLRALFSVVDQHYFSGDFDGVVRRGKQYLEMQPSPEMRAEVNALLSNALEATGHIDEAVEAMRSAIADQQSNERKAALTVCVGQTYVRAKQYTQAMQVLKTVKNLPEASDEAKVEAMYLLGRCCRGLNNNSAACDYMNSVTKQYPGTSWARQARGQLYLWGVLKPAGEPK